MTDPIVARFNRVSEAYDRQLIPERRALRVAAALAGPVGGLRVVDPATGSGAPAAAFLAGPGRPASLIGVDASPRMLQRARLRLGPSTALLRADARAVPLPDGAAGLVATGYLRHLRDPAGRASVLGETFSPRSVTGSRRG